VRLDFGSTFEPYCCNYAYPQATTSKQTVFIEQSTVARHKLSRRRRLWFVIYTSRGSLGNSTLTSGCYQYLAHCYSISVSFPVISYANLSTATRKLQYLLSTNAFKAHTTNVLLIVQDNIGKINNSRYTDC